MNEQTTTCSRCGNAAFVEVVWEKRTIILMEPAKPLHVSDPITGTVILVEKSYVYCIRAHWLLR